MIWRTLLAVSAMALASCGGNSSDEDEAVDSDSDGLTDAEEADLGLDANNDDTDGDGVLDGTEVGVVIVGPDTDVAVFIPDADPTLRTNPRAA